MSQKRKAEAGAINIRLHPHPNRNYYVKLLNDIFSLRQSLRSRGDQMLLLSSLHRPRDVNGQLQMRGTLARFTNIDTQQNWFNLETNDEAEDEDIRQIRIPDNLRPNFKPFSFIFFPEHHKFIFEKYSDNSSISHGVVANFLKRLLEFPTIQERYGEVNVDVISDHRGLRAILSIPHLKHLEIIIDRPNPDDHADEERVILERMNAQKVNRIEQRLTAISGQSITPDRDTKVLAKVALENGKVVGDGKNETGDKVEYSTKNYPRTERMKFDPEAMSASDAFNQLAEKFILGGRALDS